jgi:hypothetical protein
MKKSGLLSLPDFHARHILSEERIKAGFWYLKGAGADWIKRVVG